MNTALKSNPTIRQLPANLVNQIAAGEVIERPASVVKELLENSVDSGAGRIELTIAGGGSELIRVSDDGCGIPDDQLTLAVTSHATSKLPDEDALFHVGTLGFRGEALASIGSVSQLTIRSRTDAEDSGHELNVRGGIIEGPAPCGCPVGTVIEVRNLFFNTPVRHKFLKSAQTERGHIVESFTRLALANPQIHWVMRQGDRLVHDLPITSRWADRIAAFFGPDVADALIPVHSDDADIQIDGFVCDPSVSRGNNRMQYLFINGRHIRDRALQHALGEAYRGMLMVGRMPVCFLRLTMPAEMIDVNVHPCKLEVRFTDSGRVYSRLLQTLRHQFLSTNLTQRVGPPSPAENTDTQSQSGDSVLGVSAKAMDAQRQSVINWARTGSETSSSPTPEFKPFPTSSSPVQSPGLPGGDGAPWDPAGVAIDAPSPAAPDIAASPATARSAPVSVPQPASSPAFGSQIHNRYLVTQDEKGMVVIDQHALHERVLYQRVCRKVLQSGEALESQRLLVPEPVTLTPAEHAAALGVAETLEQIGLQIEDFGDKTILIHAYPAMLPSKPPAEMLHVVLEQLMGAGKQPDARDILDHLLATIACKAAVKAGDPLAPEEITSLLEQRDLFQDTHHCPHGRPTALFFSLDELDRMFGRLGPRGKV